VASPWPEGFRRVPDEDWTTQPVESFALKYDTVENHGWYRNLDHTVEQLRAYLRDGSILVDYSGGTGILVDRLLPVVPNLDLGILIVDSSPKFLRLALEKFRNDERVAFRLIRYLKKEKRLEFMDEALPPGLVRRRVDAVVSTNAIHLYYDLADTLQSWVRILRPDGRVFVQSGNIRNPDARPGEWIIDETVETLQCAAVELVRMDPRYVSYRPALEDVERMREYTALRRKFFLPVRPLDAYLEALRQAGLRILSTSHVTIEARVDEWYRFLSVYHEGVLGWVGGSQRIDGAAPSESALEDRLALLRNAMDRVFDSKEVFKCCWTYVECGANQHSM
jgi:SAM-dependent methyltransferase